jgi:Zn-dependent peptidase ImmA (M78 family)
LKLDIPYYSYADIGKIANSFLNTYHPSLGLPIPIEKIVDVKMNISIFPLPRLYKEHNQNGFLSRDRKIIFVDEYQYDNFYEKYRFTLAHELGHYLLHKSCYENLPFKSSDEYIEWRMSISPEDISWFDTHCDWFAGHVLIPSKNLKEICGKIAKKYLAVFSKFKISPDDFWSYASKEIATYFEVNSIPVEIRIRKENIMQKIEIDLKKSD